MITEISYEKKEAKKNICMSNFIPLIYPYTNMAWWLLAEGIKSSLTSFPYYLSALYRLR